MAPLISVIIPVYQVEHYIANCLKSVLNQTFRDFEVVLVDDGTRDGSAKIAQAILTDSDIEHRIITQDNRGLSAARNIGIKNSNGRWIVCVDSDDVLYKDFLKILYEPCLRYDSPVSIGGFQYVDDKTLFKAPDRICSAAAIEKDEMVRGFLTRNITIIAPAMLVSKDFIIGNNLFYDESIVFSEDQQFIWRVLFAADRCICNRTPIYNYFLRPYSIMASSGAQKMKSGYHSFAGFTEELKDTEDERLCDTILARWVLGSLHSAARTTDYQTFRELASDMRYREKIGILYGFNDIKVKLLSVMLGFNLKLFYAVGRKL